MSRQTFRRCIVSIPQARKTTTLAAKTGVPCECATQLRLVQVGWLSAAGTEHVPGLGSSILHGGCKNDHEKAGRRLRLAIHKWIE